MRKEKRRIAFAGGLFFLDRALKFWAVKQEIASFNKGVSFGFFSFEFLPFLAFLILLAVFVFWKKKISGWGFLLILVGGLSNLLDRVFYGGVVDFVKFWFLPNFNSSDVFIIFGAGAILFDLVRKDRLL